MRIADRFWAKVEKADGDECWLWKGSQSGDGYGAFKVVGRQVGAHRFAYELNIGAIPPGLSVLHRCDVPLCVRPSHLFVGTTADNMADKVAKGRSLRGERNNKARLTEEDVRSIRLLRAQGVELKDLAQRFGVQFPAIWKIVQRKTWKHVA